MKKLLLVGIFTVSIAVGSNVKAQAVEEGKVLVDAYFGYGTLFNSLFRTAYSGTDVDSKFTGLDAMGIRGEYLLADKFGIGIDFCYSSAKIVDPYTVSIDNYDSNGNFTGTTTTSYTQTFSTKKIGVMATMNYHFLENDKVDAYGVFGIGYKNRSYAYDSTDPTSLTDQNLGVGTLLPLAMRIGIGARYFFTDNIGLTINTGLGQGGWINGGLAFKF